MALGRSPGSLAQVKPPFWTRELVQRVCVCMREREVQGYDVPLAHVSPTSFTCQISVHRSAFLLLPTVTIFLYMYFVIWLISTPHT